jgi:hypothetical protein
MLYRTFTSCTVAWYPGGRIPSGTGYSCTFTLSLASHHASQVAVSSCESALCLNKKFNYQKCMKNLESKKYVNSEFLTLTSLGWALSQCGHSGYSPKSPFLMSKSVKIVHMKGV